MTSTFVLHGAGWRLDATREVEWVTNDGPTADESWRFTDARGHEHAYPYKPTLEFVVDRSHWCDGTEGLYNHDPHEAIDEGHYECRECRERIEPRSHPPGYMTAIPRALHGTLTWRVDRSTTCKYLIGEGPVGELFGIFARTNQDSARDTAVRLYVDAHRDDWTVDSVMLGAR